MVVSGPGQIRWGVGDLADVEASTYGTDDENVRENGGILMDVNVGDLFVIPAGIAHKNYDPFTRTGDGKLDLGLADGEGEGPGSGTEGKAKCLTGNARGIQAEDPRAFVENLQSKLRGFVMMGAYPKGEEWSWGDASDKGRVDFEEVWNVKRPALDPYVGENGGLLKYWK